MQNRPSFFFDPWVQGTFFGLISAVGYTATNAFLRSVSEELDPIWISAVKSVPTTMLLGPWLLWKLYRKEHLIDSPVTAMRVIIAGLIAQLGGNVAFQWALSQVGLAVSVPLTLGGMIVAAAILARIFLHEPITIRAAMSMTVLMAAIVLLSVGAESVAERPSSTEVAQSVSTWKVLLGAGAAAGSGLAYAILNVAIRDAVTRGASLSFTLTSVSVTGIVSLGMLSISVVGWEHISMTTPNQWSMMVLVGVFNALSFLALTISLRLTSVVYVNALNASQTAMAAFAGVLFFNEMLSPWLLLGLLLTVAGLLLMRQGKSAEIAPPEEI